jgi:transcriptional regulator with XRE-family HTH domain
MGMLTSAQCRAARGRLEWTQDARAERAGVSRSTVRDFEGGRHEPHRATQCQVAAALEAAGVLFVVGGEAGPGVQLRAPV